jgi:hypothetical protein
MFDFNAIVGSFVTFFQNLFADGIVQFITQLFGSLTGGSN